MKITCLILFSCLLFGVASAQKVINRNDEIASMVSEVNPDSLKSYISSLVAFGTRSTVGDTQSKKSGIGAARSWVVSKFSQFAKNSNGRLSAYLDTTTYKADGKRVAKDFSLANAVAILKGTDAADKRIFIISGHVDSRVTDVMNGKSDAPGANDDGSGVAAVLETARIMSRHAFPATIIFVAVSGEEQGLLGSTFMANKARAEKWEIAAVLNNDIMGSNNSSGTNIIDNTRLRVFSEGLPNFELDKTGKYIRQLGLENDGQSRQLARYVKEVGERYVDHLEIKLIYRSDRFLRGGDHLPYLENGFAAVRLTEMNENFNHQHQDLRTENGIEYGDLIKFMDFEYLRKNTAVNLSVLANLTMSASKPLDVKIDVKNLSNSSALSWKAPKNGKAVGYFVLMRESSSAMWEKKFFTTSTEMVLPYSKDNYLFAVQSVGENYTESLAEVPSIGR